MEIRRQAELINQIKKILGGGSIGETKTNNITPSSNINMWFEKLGKGMPYNILKFLVEKSGLKFTRSQIALACGYSANGGSFGNALSLLRRNVLIKEDGGLIQVNPDL